MLLFHLNLLSCMCLFPTLYSETPWTGVIFVEYINPMWPYPVIVDAQNSVNTCEIKQSWPRAGMRSKWQGERKRESRKWRERKRRGRGRKNIFPEGAAAFTVSLGAKYNPVLNDEGPSRDFKPTMTFLHLSSNNIVFEPLMLHPISLAFLFQFLFSVYHLWVQGLTSLKALVFFI